MTQVFCSRPECGKSIPPSGARIVIDGKYICAACLYSLEHGRESYERQVQLANKQAGRCTCTPRMVKRHWGGGDKLTQRAVHAAECPKRQAWMEEELLAS